MTLTPWWIYYCKAARKGLLGVAKWFVTEEKAASHGEEMAEAAAEGG